MRGEKDERKRAAFFIQPRGVFKAVSDAIATKYCAKQEIVSCLTHL